MAEGINLNTTFHATPGTTRLRFGGLTIQRLEALPGGRPRVAPYIRVWLLGENGERVEHEVGGPQAAALMGQLNTADFRTVSLLHRVTKWLLDNRADLSGSVGDVAEPVALEDRRPIPPTLSTMKVDDLAGLAREHEVYPTRGSGSGGAVLKADLITALEGARG